MTTITRHPAPPANTQGYILDDEGTKYIAVVYSDGDLRIDRVSGGSISFTPSLIQAIQTLAIAHDIIPPPDPMDAEIVAALKTARDVLIGEAVAPHTIEYIDALLKRMNQ